MSTLDTAALWSATSLAFDEKKLGAAGLSVRQRKLLALLNQPASVAQLAQRIALPDSEVQSALERFAKLGLAQSDAPTAFDPMQVRASPARAAMAEKPSRMPLIVGAAIAALALVAASAWLLRGGSEKALPEPAVAKAATASPSTQTGPTDSADSKLPRSAAAPTVAPAATPAPATATTAALVPPVTAAAKAATAPAPTATTVSATPGKNTVAPATPAPAAVPANAAVATVAPTPAAAAATATAPATVAAPPAVAPPVAAALVPPPTTPSPSVAAAPAAPAVAARPTPAVAREIKLINRVEPGFPRGVDTERGTVRARLQVDARGNVTSVDIVESNPPRVFDRTVRSALQQWRYEPTGEAFTTAAEISFSR